jgi:hypothetical protein
VPAIVVRCCSTSSAMRPASRPTRKGSISVLPKKAMGHFRHLRRLGRQRFSAPLRWPRRESWRLGLQLPQSALRFHDQPGGEVVARLAQLVDVGALHAPEREAENVAPPLVHDREQALGVPGDAAIRALALDPRAGCR